MAAVAEDVEGLSYSLFIALRLRGRYPYSRMIHMLAIRVLLLVIFVSRKLNY